MDRASRFAVLDLVSALVLVLDAKGRLVFWNRACAELTGLHLDALAGQRAWELAPEEREGSGTAAALRGLSPSRPHATYESTWQTHHGTRHFLAWSAQAVLGEDSQVSQVVVTGTDVTDHKRAEHALELARAEAEGILSISADAIISIDEAQRVTLFNQGAEKAFGYSKEEVLGRPVELLMPERFRAPHAEQVRQFGHGPIAARRMGERRAVPARRKNGEEFPTDAAISKIEVGGRMVYTAVMRDITERERLENDQRFLINAGKILGTSLEYEKVLTDVAELAVGTLADCCIVDILEEDGRARRLRVAVADPARKEMAEALRGYPHAGSHQPTFAKEALETGAPKLVAEVPAGLVESIAESSEHLRLLRELAPRSYMAIPLVARDMRFGAVVFISSSRRYTPHDLHLANDLGVRSALAIQNARLLAAAHQATRARDAMLGIVAHDLRNPLNAIGMSAQLLGRKLRKGVGPEEAEKSIETIRHATVRANRLIADLLDVTRSEAGTLSVDLKPWSPAALISAAVEGLRPLLAAHRLELEIPTGLPAVRADRDRIVQVFSNLVGNAIKFTPPGGRIAVGAGPAEAAVAFYVADSGQGIPAEHQQRLFERFWQANQNDRRGTGLGLPIAKGIVEAHGGKLWVKSAPGAGSTFFFTLPFA